ncbi:MAG TPA: ATP-binding cassette domain-containing protein [Solirubrobacteraceae bacterium]|nr:ATP-binding cassette domain-containing protein [Solirubrobacteraceae bacterium]
MVLLIIIGVAVVIGVIAALLRWDRYQGNRKAAVEGGRVTPTDEVFVDPDSGHRMRVWHDPRTGRREYRLDDPSDATFGATPPVALPRVAAGSADTGPADTGPVDTGTVAIKVAGLTKRFGATVAVDGLSFTVNTGRIVGFLGPNGAGKTTTMRMLLGLMAPTAGSATINGRRYPELERPAQTVGALLDGDDLHSGRTGRNHLRVLAAAAGVPATRVEEVLALVDLTAAADRRAGGYSMGMRQRLGLAAAMLGDPRVLVLDEPANGLDPQGIRWLRDFLRSLAAEGRAILISSHVLAEVAQIVDEVVVINRGRSVLQAPLTELMAQRAGGMRVAGPDVIRLAELLRADGADVRSAADGAIVVSGRSGEQIGRMIAQHQIVVCELATCGESLEDVFFELTGAEGGPS